MIILTSLAYNLFFFRLRIVLLSLANFSSFACESFFSRLRIVLLSLANFSSFACELFFSRLRIFLLSLANVLLSLANFSSFACDIVAYESFWGIFPFAFSSCLHHIFCFVCFILLFRFVAVSTLIALFSAFIDYNQCFY